ncbi:MAG: hypothetical protein E3J66_01930 [Dehalococcoidia bacterium]|nr:MAG: hypothetical protein E3J66_01930 [Dehalococcoidia bacterium]
MAKVKGAREAEAALTALVKAYPNSPEPRISLGKLYRWMALRDAPSVVDRSRLRSAREELLCAISLEDPPKMTTLEFLWHVTNDLAMHKEQAVFFTHLGRQDGRPQVRFQALCWSAIALECRGCELWAHKKEKDAVHLFDQGVKLHREALAVWPDAPIRDRLKSYHGGSHIQMAYSHLGKHKQWTEEVEHLLALDEGKRLPAGTRADYLVYASDMASNGKLFEEAIRLGEKALEELQVAEAEGIDRLRRISVLGALLRGYHGKGDFKRKEEVGRRIQNLLSDWEKRVSEEPQDICSCYNVASRNFVVAEDWQRAIETCKRTVELWDFGPNHWFLAVALWAGRKDRIGALNALCNAARDARMSGIGMCRNLREDFLKSSVFADVRDDPAFLQAIEVEGIIE